MCGLYGFIGTTKDDRPDGDRLGRVAQLASRRGPHAHGWVGIQVSGAWAHVRCADLYSPKHLLHGALECNAIIGHCRLGTSGNYREIENVQPLEVERIWIAHNGVFPDHLRMADTLGVKLQTGNDSEIIGWILRRMATGGKEGMADVLGDTVHVMSNNGAVPFALLLLTAEGFGVAREGHPLYEWVHPEGVYYCSLQPAPEARELPEWKSRFIRFASLHENANCGNSREKRH